MSEIRKGDRLELVRDFIDPDNNIYIRSGVPCVCYSKWPVIGMVTVSIKTPIVGFNAKVPVGHVRKTDRILRTYVPDKEPSKYLVDRSDNRILTKEITKLIDEGSLVDIHYYRHDTEGGNAIIKCRILALGESERGAMMINIRPIGSTPIAIPLDCIYEMRVAKRKFRPSDGLKDATV